MKTKFFISFFIFFLFTSCISASDISMSPPQINFVGKTGEVICQKVLIQVSGTETLDGKTLWAEEGYSERKLSEHKLLPYEIDLEVRIPEIIQIYEKENLEICIVGSNEGIYHGALLYKIENKPLQVGIWMNVSLEGNSLLKITGNFVKDVKRQNFGINISIMLGVILIVLLIWSWKKN